MTLSEALDPTTRISLDEAIWELRQHHHIPSIRHQLDYSELIDSDGRQIAMIDIDGMVSSLDVMTWLGY